MGRFLTGPQSGARSLAREKDPVINAASTGAVESRPPAPAARGSRRTRGLHVAGQFLKFGAVGASGFLVNQGVFVLAKKIREAGLDLSADDAFLNLLGSQFHVRWYHVFAVLAFVIANVWNFVLNRYWTFSGVQKRAWWKQLPVFMAVGLFGLVITLFVLTALVNPESPIALSREIFDGSTGLRTPEYWGNFIGVMVAVPANFLFNKLWTFRGSNDGVQRAVTHVPAREGEDA